jgi:hypothetical protein
VHHSITYVCEPGSQAESDARQLLASTGTGPYDEDKHVKKCSQLYMVRPSAVLLGMTIAASLHMMTKQQLLLL